MQTPIQAARGRARGLAVTSAVKASAGARLGAQCPVHADGLNGRTPAVGRPCAPQDAAKYSLAALPIRRCAPACRGGDNASAPFPCHCARPGRDIRALRPGAAAARRLAASCTPPTGAAVGGD